MVYVNFPEDLKDRETRAYRVEKSEVKKGSKSKNLSDIYKELGDDCAERGFRDKATSNYRDALKFAPRGGEERIEEKLAALENKNLGKLVRRLTPVFAIVSFVIALFFVSFSLTGYVTGGLTQENSRWIGLCLFACGLIFTFLYFKSKE